MVFDFLFAYAEFHQSKSTLLIEKSARNNRNHPILTIEIHNNVFMLIPNQIGNH